MANTSTTPSAEPNQRSGNNGEAGEVEIQIRKTTRSKQPANDQTQPQSDQVEIQIQKSGHTKQPPASQNQTQDGALSISQPSNKPLGPRGPDTSRLSAPPLYSTTAPRQSARIPGSNTLNTPSVRQGQEPAPTTASPTSTSSTASSTGSNKNRSPAAAEPTSNLPERQPAAAVTPPSPEDRQRMQQGLDSGDASTGIGRPAGRNRGRLKRFASGARSSAKSGANRLRMAVSRRPEGRAGNIDTAPPGRDTLKSLEQGENSADNTTEQRKDSADSSVSSAAKGKSDAAASSTKKEEDLVNAKEEEKPGRFQALRKLLSTRRWKIAAGGGLVATIIGLFFGFSVLQGPFQFIHFAQLLRGFHLTSHEDAGDGRVGKFYRFVRSGGDFGETRVGYLGSKYKNKIFADWEKIGIKLEFGSFRIANGITIDTKNPESPYRNMTQEQVKAKLAERNVKDGIEFRKNGEVFVELDRGYLKDTRAINALVSDLGYSKVGSAIRARPLQKYGLVTWHPIKKLDKKLNQKVGVLYENWRQNREKALSNGIRDGSFDPENAKHQRTVVDADGNETVVTDNIGEQKSRTKELFNKIRSGGALKAAGGIAAIAGAICLVREVNENVGIIRKENIIDPLIRIGSTVLTIGNQIMSGQDVDLDTMGFVQKNFNGVSTKGVWPGTGAPASTRDRSTSAFDAASIQAEQGNKVTGLDIDGGVKENIAGPSPGWLSWAGASDFKELCSQAGMIITGIVSAVIGVLTGNTVNTAVGIATGLAFGPLVIEKMADFVAGQAVNVAAVGAEFGNYANYGLRLAANSMALMTGGSELSKTQEKALKDDVRQEQLANFRAQDWSYRLFNPYDPDSAISKLIDRTPPSSQGLASWSGLFTRNPLNSLGELFSSRVKAAENTEYDYGFPKYGFNKQELEDSRFADPFANADGAALILNNDLVSGQKYITKAKNCFGVDLQKKFESGANKELWNVLPSAEPANPYDPDYPSFDCSNQDLDWLRIRFFIFDTGVIEGWACFNDDETSCQNNGFTAGETATGSTTTTGGAPTGSSTTTIGNQDGDSSHIACAAGSVEVVAEYTAHVNGTPRKVRLCKVLAIPCDNEECRGDEKEIPLGPGNYAIVNSQVSASWVALAAKAKAQGIKLYATSSLRTYEHQGRICRDHAHHEENGVCISDSPLVASQGHSPHESGTAIDLIIPNSTGDSGSCAGRATQPTDPVWNFMKNNAPAFGILQYSGESWHWDTNPAGLGNRCA